VSLSVIYILGISLIEARSPSVEPYLGCPFARLTWINNALLLGDWRAAPVARNAPMAIASPIG